MKKGFSSFGKCDMDDDDDDLNQCDIKWWCGADFNQTTKKKDPKGSRMLSFQRWKKKLLLALMSVQNLPSEGKTKANIACAYIFNLVVAIFIQQ